jgi:hypothetical protein
MPSTTTRLLSAFWAGTLAASSIAAGLVDVTFTVPVQVQNIRANWSKVGVFCLGMFRDADRGSPISPQSFRLVGVIDVSNKARQTISQTVTGTVQLPDNSTDWQCELRIQFTGQTTFSYRLEQEIRPGSVTSAAGKL